MKLKGSAESHQFLAGIKLIVNIFNANS